MPARIPNVLLMLSTKQPPEPEYEVEWHERKCKEEGRTYLVTTRDEPDTLRPGKSIVAMYGNAKIRNKYLARGCFESYISSWNDPGRFGQLLADSELYTERSIPDNACGFIELSRFHLAEEGEYIDLDTGVWHVKLRGKWRDILIAHPFPKFQNRSCIIFWTDGPLCNGDGGE